MNSRVASLIGILFSSQLAVAETTHQLACSDSEVRLEAKIISATQLQDLKIWKKVTSGEQPVLVVDSPNVRVFTNSEMLEATLNDPTHPWSKEGVEEIRRVQEETDRGLRRTLRLGRGAPLAGFSLKIDREDPDSDAEDPDSSASAQFESPASTPLDETPFNVGIGWLPADFLQRRGFKLLLGFLTSSDSESYRLDCRRVSSAR